MTTHKNRSTIFAQVFDDVKLPIATVCATHFALLSQNTGYEDLYLRVHDAMQPVGLGLYSATSEIIDKEIENNENKLLRKLRLLLHPGSVRIRRSII